MSAAGDGSAAAASTAAARLGGRGYVAQGGRLSSAAAEPPMIPSSLQPLQQHATGSSAVSGLAVGLRPLPLLKVHQAQALSGGRAPPSGVDTITVQRADQPDKGSRGASALPEAGSAALQQQQQLVGEQLGMADAAVVKQPVLVRDLLRAVQGLQGTYTSFAAGVSDPGAPGAGMRLAGADVARITEGHRTMLHELGELGLMFRRVQAAIDAGARRRGGGPEHGRGSVHQALCAALYEEVTDFLRLMAVLEGQLAVPQPTPDMGDSAGPYLTLRRLQLWLAEPLRRMRLLAVLADASGGAKGGELAGRVWAATKVGDPLARSYATRVLHQVCVPLFAMIRRWVFEGVLEDPGCEFFVRSTGAAHRAGGGATDAWRDLYALEPAHLPPFVSRELAAAVLRAGKSINFLRDACGGAAWVQDWAPAAAGAAAQLGFGQLPVLERVVASASAAVDARLMAVLRGSGEWDRHCQAIRRYLLLGQGDFVVALLDLMGPELAAGGTSTATGKSESMTSKLATLNHLLRQVLLSCAGGVNDDANGPQELLRVELAEAAGAGESGWDAFSLSYALGPPLSTVFTPAAQAQYSRLGRLLWLLRRTERSLNDAWRILKVEVERSLPAFAGDACAAELADVLRACLRLQSEMAHITTNLQYYLHLEVVECAWSEFMAAAAAAPDLDCLIAAHDRFLAALLDRALLGGGLAEGLRHTLRGLLGNCMALQPAVGRLNAMVMTGRAELDARRRRADANTAAGGWGSSGLGGRRPVVDVGQLADLRHTLDSIAAQHSTKLAAFLKGLPGAANEVNAEVRFLLARLDFSGFYTPAGHQHAA